MATKQRGRSALAIVLLVIATLLVPTAIVGHWATVQISNSNRFVDSLAPLSDNPQVQTLVITKLSDAIEKKVNVNETTQTLVDGLGSALKLGPKAKDALNLISAPLAAGIENLITDTVSKVVKSPAFQKAWKTTITITHKELIAVLSGRTPDGVNLAADGTITLSLKPLMQEVKNQMIAAKVPFARVIPTIDTTITVAKIPQLATARIAYQVGVGVGMWLPWFVLAMFAGAVLLAVRRWRMVFISALLIFIMAGLVGIGLSTGRIILTASLNADLTQVAGAVYDTVIGYGASVVVTLMILSALLAIVAGIYSFDSATRLRTWIAQSSRKVWGRAEEVTAVATKKVGATKTAQSATKTTAKKVASKK